MIRCANAKEPEGWVCLAQEGPHGDHIAKGGNTWPNEMVLSQAQHRSKGLTVQAIVAGARPSSTAARDTGHLLLTQSPRGVGESIPAEARQAWSQQDWTKATEQRFREFLLTRAEPFTTAEDFWPLITAPQQMRALSVVVQSALRQEWLCEQGAVRLRGLYRSADGVEFKMNKLVPVYLSRIHQG